MFGISNPDFEARRSCEFRTGNWLTWKGILPKIADQHGSLWGRAGHYPAIRHQKNPQIMAERPIKQGCNGNVCSGRTVGGKKGKHVASGKKGDFRMEHV